MRVLSFLVALSILGGSFVSCQDDKNVTSASNNNNSTMDETMMPMDETEAPTKLDDEDLITEESDAPTSDVVIDDDVETVTPTALVTVTPTAATTMAQTVDTTTTQTAAMTTAPTTTAEVVTPEANNATATPAPTGTTTTGPANNNNATATAVPTIEETEAVTPIDVDAAVDDSATNNNNDNNNGTGLDTVQQVPVGNTNVSVETDGTTPSPTPTPTEGPTDATTTTTTSPTTAESTDQNVTIVEPKPTNGSTCAVTLSNSDAVCAELLKFTTAVCDCYNFCTGKLIACLEFGEQNSFSCAGETVAGCTAGQKVVSAARPNGVSPFYYYWGLTALVAALLTTI
jgi:hypothetical protein